MLQPSKTFVVCEMSQTYEGSFEVASRLVQAAVEAKSDAIKFQVFKASELATPDYKHFGLFSRLELPPQQWGVLIDQAHQGSIRALADVFGIKSAQMLLEQKIDGFKIHPTDIKNIPLLIFLAKSGKPLLLSVGGSYPDEITLAIATLRKNGASEIILMHGFQSYPTLVEDANLNKMVLLHQTYGLPVGFADHIDGDHMVRYDLCALAMGLGARLIEKHITVDRALKMEDYESALNPSEFKEFVGHIRALDNAFGSASLNLSKAEEAYRKVTKKHIVAARNLPAGTLVSESDIAMKRTAEEYDFQNQEDILGKKTRQEIAKDRVIRLEFLD